MRRIGHRGAKGHVAENTIASFQKAFELGCDEVETDVWLTPDGRLVISHDAPPADAKLTLSEVLDFCRGKMAVNVELKAEASESRARDTGARVAAALRDEKDAYVSSFWWSALEAARNAVPPVRRAFLFSDAPEREALIQSARGLRLWALHPNRTYVTPELVRDAHAAGLRVNVWTVNDPAEASRLREWGVDGVMSDYPERVPKE